MHDAADLTEASPSRLRGWLALLRVPNLFTVPGDPWAGAALAVLGGAAVPRPSQFLLLGLVSLSLYIFGLVLNDLVDLNRDRLERPERPLVRGLVTKAQALRLLTNVLLAGILVSGLLGRRTVLTAAALAAAIAAYNLWLKRVPPFGWLAMGACRGLSLLLGASLLSGWSWPPCLAAAGLAAYIASVTWLAARENQAQAFAWRGRVPALIMVTASVLLSVLLPPTTPTLETYLGMGAFLLAVGTAWATGVRLGRGASEPHQTQAAVGRLIRALMPWQAAYLLLAQTGSPAALTLSTALLLAWPLAGWVGRRIAGS